jgi:hypothetical protein
MPVEQLKFEMTRPRKQQRTAAPNSQDFAEDRDSLVAVIALRKRLRRQCQ